MLVTQVGNFEFPAREVFLASNICWEKLFLFTLSITDSNYSVFPFQKGSTHFLMFFQANVVVLQSMTLQNPLIEYLSRL